jgi:hypothetical protein
VAQPVYTYEIRDLATNELLENVPLRDVSFSKILNDTSSCTATLPLPLYDSLGKLRETYELTTPAHTCLYVYRDTKPVWGGVIWTSLYNSEQSTIQLGAADWWSLLDHRKILPVLTASAFTNTGHVAGLKTTYTQQDQNEICRQLLAQAQAHTGGNLGIVASTSNSAILRDRTYPGFSMTSLGDALRNLSQVIDGPDIRFDVGHAGADGKPARLMLIGTPRLGQVGSEHVWELGGNIASYSWPRDATRMRSRSFAVGEGTDEGTPIGVSEDTGLYTLGWPLLEDDSSYDRTSGDTSTLIAHAAADQELGRLPVVLPMLKVRGDVAPTVAELSPGDDGRVIINDHFHGYGPPLGSRGLDTYMRLVKMEVSPTEAGEFATLTMAPTLEDLA